MDLTMLVGLSTLFSVKHGCNLHQLVLTDFINDRPMWPVFLYINFMRNLNKWTFSDWAILVVLASWILGMAFVLTSVPIN
jgi:hypothetical protein